MPWFEKDWSVRSQSFCYFIPMFFPIQPVIYSLYIFRTALLGVEEPEVVDGGECGCVFRSQCLLLPGQRTVVHSLCLFEMALIDVEVPKVVDGVERGCVLGSPCLLITGQCTVVNSLR